jgi:uncharacterized membrane protein YdcZ (DUF606 family)
MNQHTLEAQLSNALKPVAPRLEFLSQLKTQLTQPHTPSEVRSPVWLIVAGIGGLVSVAGVVLVVARLGGTLMRRASESLPRSSRMASAPQ